METHKFWIAKSRSRFRAIINLTLTIDVEMSVFFQHNVKRSSELGANFPQFFFDIYLTHARISECWGGHETRESKLRSESVTVAWSIICRRELITSFYFTAIVRNFFIHFSANFLLLPFYRYRAFLSMTF